jgi:DNA-binding winged helix-turn-helix (wHTH) protein
MSRPASRFYEFGPFRLDTAQHILLRDGQPVPLTPKALDILSVLVHNSGQLVDRNTLMSEVWPDSFIEENNITQNVSVLRRTLGDGANGRSYIETFAKRGYRFVASVRQLPDAESAFARTSVATEPENSANYQIKSIAVLPFKVFGNEASDKHLELGLADALITKLSNIRQIVVRPTSSLLKYAGLKEDPLTIGRELGVDLLLDCSIQKLSERIRVTAQLVSVEAGRSLWADKFDELPTDIFAMQDSISERVTAALMLKLSSEEKRLLAKRDTESGEAYEAFLKGRYHWNKRTEEDLLRSIEHFQRAIEIDSNYAMAYSGLADAYALMGDYSLLPPNESFPKARAAAVKALAIDDMLADAHASLAFVKLEYDWDCAGAEVGFKRAIEINPSYATAYQWYAYYLTAVGSFDRGIDAIRMAHQLDPLSLVISTDVGEIYYLARRYDEAVAHLSRALEMDRNFVRAHETLGLVYVQKGMYAAAIKEFQEAATLSRGMTESQAGYLGHAYGLSGDRKKAQKLLADMKRLSKKSHVSSYYILLIYVGIGETERAVEWLQCAYDERPGWLVYMNVEPMFDTLRSNPRFAQLSSRIGIQSR